MLLRDVAQASTPGSRMLFDYPLAPRFVSPADAELVQSVDAGTADLGETRKLKLAPSELLAMVSPLGFERLEELSPQEHYARYFANRSDGLGPNPEVHLALLRRTDSAPDSQ